MSRPFPALLVTFEGIDGSGKSTQAARLVERLRAEGADPLAVREPGGTELSERIRSLLLDPSQQIGARAELLLFAAARAQLVEEVVAPALRAGRPVVCDRFFDSTTAYQGGGRGLGDVKWLNDFHRFTTAGLSPHRTYVVDVPPETAALRRGISADRMEAEGDDFFRRVRGAYLRLAELEPRRVRVIDGSASPDAIQDLIWRDLCDLAEGTVSRPSGKPAHH